MQKILVVEPVRDYQNFLVEHLVANGFHALGIDRGEEALRLARKVRPDVIIWDIMGADTAVLQQIETLHQNFITGNIPTIFLLGEEDRGACEALFSIAHVECLFRPVDDKELLGGIARLLAREKKLGEQQKVELDRAEEILSYLTNYDGLTKLPNKKALFERLDAALRQAVKNDEVVVLLSLGLNQFDRIKEQYGRSAANKALQEVGERLLKCVDEDDGIARLEEDHFALMVTTDSEAISDGAFIGARVAQQVIKAFSSPVKLGNGVETQITVSLGIAIYPCDSAGDVPSLLNSAKIAMYQAKKRGTNNYEFYGPEAFSASYEQLNLEIDLASALDNAEFELFYQPQIDLANGGIVGLEALIRWRHPKEGLIPPGRFISMAEENGLIVPIGEWTLEKAARQAMEWRKQGFKVPRIAVNLSAKQFNQPQLAKRLVQILRQSGLDPTVLELELTETTLMADIEGAVRTLFALKSVGITLAIDDFGTGYSSLSHLRHFPFDILKIDQRFVHNLGDDPQNNVIINAIIHMAHRLDLRVVAEGVETTEELFQLKEQDCDAVQGFVFSRPLPAAEIGKILKEQKQFPI